MSTHPYPKYNAHNKMLRTLVNRTAVSDPVRVTMPADSRYIDRRSCVPYTPSPPPPPLPLPTTESRGEPAFPISPLRPRGQQTAHPAEPGHYRTPRRPRSPQPAHDATQGVPEQLDGRGDGHHSGRLSGLARQTRLQDEVPGRHPPASAER